jgi:hypothetical protein
MTDLDKRLRLNEANSEAKRLGYRISVEMQLNRRTHTAFAHHLTDDTERHFLCHRDSPAVDTLEDGLEILRGVVEAGHPWPGGEPKKR